MNLSWDPKLLFRALLALCRVPKNEAGLVLAEVCGTCEAPLGIVGFMSMLFT